MPIRIRVGINMRISVHMRIGLKMRIPIHIHIVIQIRIAERQPADRVYADVQQRQQKRHDEDQVVPR